MDPSHPRSTSERLAAIEESRRRVRALAGTDLADALDRAADVYWQGRKAPETTAELHGEEAAARHQELETALQLRRVAISLDRETGRVRQSWLLGTAAGAICFAAATTEAREALTLPWLAAIAGTVLVLTTSLSSQARIWMGGFTHAWPGRLIPAALALLLAVGGVWIARRQAAEVLQARASAVEEAREEGYRLARRGLQQKKTALKESNSALGVPLLGPREKRESPPVPSDPEIDDLVQASCEQPIAEFKSQLAAQVKLIQQLRPEAERAKVLETQLATSKSCNEPPTMPQSTTMKAMKTGPSPADDPSVDSPLKDTVGINLIAVQTALRQLGVDSSEELSVEIHRPKRELPVNLEWRSAPLGGERISSYKVVFRILVGKRGNVIDIKPSDETIAWTEDRTYRQFYDAAFKETQRSVYEPGRIEISAPTWLTVAYRPKVP